MEAHKQRLILREQKAGYEVLRRYDQEDQRRATVSERLYDLDALVMFARDLNLLERESPDSQRARERWSTVRERYERANR